MLPDRLRRRVSAVHSSVSSVSWSGDVIDPEALSLLSVACRDSEEVRFDYRRGDGEESRRLVEPHQLVTVGRRWYLLAWDLRRNDWRTFRLDRLRSPHQAGVRFTPREIPGGDAALFVATAVGPVARHEEATLAISASFDELKSVLRWMDHTPVELQPASCVIQIRSEDLGRLAMTVARIALTAPVEVIEPAELTDTIQQLVANCSAPVVDPPRSAEHRLQKRSLSR